MPFSHYQELNKFINCLCTKFCPYLFNGVSKSNICTQTLVRCGRETTAPFSRTSNDCSSVLLCIPQIVLKSKNAENITSLMFYKRFNCHVRVPCKLCRFDTRFLYVYLRVQKIKTKDKFQPCSFEIRALETVYVRVCTFAYLLDTCINSNSQS